MDNNIVHVFWPDNRNGPVQIYSSKMMITDIKNVSGLLPDTYELSQNYPNPFNPNTSIEFAIPNSGIVKLVVFDVLSREISTLVNGHLDAGTYMVKFDASGLASGTYFYRIESGSFVAVKKMVLLK
jgi:hypothetical protein